MTLIEHHRGLWYLKTGRLGKAMVTSDYEPIRMAGV